MRLLINAMRCCMFSSLCLLAERDQLAKPANRTQTRKPAVRAVTGPALVCEMQGAQGRT